MIRIKAALGTAEFDAEYWDIRNSKKADAKYSFKEAMALTRESVRWSELSPRTRTDHDKLYEYVLQKLGSRDVRRMVQADIYDAMEKNRHRIHFANNISAALSVMFKVVTRARWRADNPALGIERLKMPASKKKPHIPWTDAAVKKMRAEGSTMGRLILELGSGSVQRPSDLVDFDWGHYDGTALILRQNKTDVPLYLPCTPELKTALEAAKARLGATPMPNRPILTGPDGGRMTYSFMAHTFLEERKRLGCKPMILPPLRYRSVMDLAWARLRR